MGYGAYLHIITASLTNVKSPIILEIGIEAGNFTIPLVNWLIDNKDNFYYHGVDIEIKPKIKWFQAQIKNKNVNFVKRNSLVELPKLINQGYKFDLILIDGDHNYYTVTKELESVEELMHNETLLLVDDFHGPYDVYDYWYGSAKDSPQKNNPLATKQVESERMGVQNAVLDWLEKHPEMMLYSLTNDDKLIEHNDERKLDDDTLGFRHGVLIKKI